MTELSLLYMYIDTIEYTHVQVILHVYIEGLVLSVEYLVISMIIRFNVHVCMFKGCSFCDIVDVHVMFRTCLKHTYMHTTDYTYTCTYVMLHIHVYMYIACVQGCLIYMYIVYA